MVLHKAESRVSFYVSVIVMVTCILSNTNIQDSGSKIKLWQNFLGTVIFKKWCLVRIMM
jgi:hypothetical protein